MTDIEKRLIWLERKLTELLWAVVGGSALFVGWVVANSLVGDQGGLLWFAVFAGAWALTGFIMHRVAFKGAPDHIQYLY